VFACGVFGSLIQWSSVETKQLSTVFEDSNVEIENCSKYYYATYKNKQAY
jgi:hypothetical protein